MTTMTPSNTPSSATYDPNLLLDVLLRQLGLKNDAALSRMLGVARPVLTGIRCGTVAVGAWLLVRISEVSGLSIADLRRLMGDQRLRLRVTSVRLRR